MTRPLPPRVQLAMDEFQQALHRLNWAASDASHAAIGKEGMPMSHQTLMRHARLNVRRANEALQYVIEQPDTPWTLHTAERAPESKSAFPNDVGAVIKKLKKTQADAGTSRMSDVARPFLPAHWWLPEVHAFTCGWLNSLKLPSMLVVAIGTFHQMDTVERTIKLATDSSVQNRWWTLFGDMNLLRIESLTVKRPFKTKEMEEGLFTVIEFFLNRTWWKTVDNDPRSAVLANGDTTEGLLAFEGKQKHD